MTGLGTPAVIRACAPMIPRGNAAVEDRTGGVAEPREPVRGALGDAITAIREHEPARAARHQSADVEFEAAVGQVDREQRVAGAVLAFLADIDKRDLAAI